MSKFAKAVVAVVCIIMAGAIIFLGFTPGGRSIWNSYTHDLQKADVFDKLKVDQKITIL